MDKLHIFPGPIPKGGFPIAADPHPVARICGGSLGPPKNSEGKGPKKYHKSFHDGTAQLTRYVDNTCPIKVTDWETKIHYQANRVISVLEKQTN